MAAILIVGDLTVTAPWVAALMDDGHYTETCEGALDFQRHFAGQPFDVMVLDIVHADQGEAMLIPQVRAKWPDCRIIVTVNDYSFSASQFYRMGLWAPDDMLLKPFALGALRRRVRRAMVQPPVETVSDLRATASTR